MLAGIALLLGTTILFKMGKKAYVGNTYSNCRVADCNNDGGYQKLFHENPKIGFLSHAKVFQRALDEGKVLAPAKMSLK